MGDFDKSSKEVAKDRKPWEKALASLVAQTIVTGLLLLKAVLKTVFNVLSALAR